MTDSVRYNGGITVRGTKTLYAVAVLDGISSAVNTATYTQIPSPVSVSGGIASQDSAIVNDSVYITSNEPIPGYRFAYWTSDDVVFDSPNATETFFIMPAKKVSVTANYKAIIYKIKGINANVSPQQNTVGKITQINASTSEKMFSH